MFVGNCGINSCFCISHFCHFFWALMPGPLLTEEGLPLPGPRNSKDLALSAPFNLTDKFTHPNTAFYQTARAEF